MNGQRLRRIVLDEDRDGCGFHARNGSKQNGAGIDFQSGGNPSNVQYGFVHESLRDLDRQVIPCLGDLIRSVRTPAEIEMVFAVGIVAVADNRVAGAVGWIGQADDGGEPIDDVFPECGKELIGKTARQLGRMEIERIDDRPLRIPENRPRSFTGIIHQDGNPTGKIQSGPIPVVQLDSPAVFEAEGVEIFIQILKRRKIIAGAVGVDIDPVIRGVHIGYVKSRAA